MIEKLDKLAQKLNVCSNAKPNHDDVLSEILEVIHVHGQQALMINTSDPKTIVFAEEMPCIHIVEHGEITIRILGENDPVTVKSGQLALLLQGNTHQVDYGGADEFTRLDKVNKQANNHNTAKHERINTSQCFWGSFSMYSDLAESILRGLPKIMVIEDLRQNPIEWLELVCQIIMGETREAKPGAKVMISRLLDLMLIQILRRWADNAETATSWLAGTKDMRISRVITALHRNLAQATIDAMAEISGMSRSSFVVLFEKTIGQKPGAYLRKWRLASAAKLLKFSGATVETISEQVGYASKVAFSRAFCKHYGKSPTMWRNNS